MKTIEELSQQLNKLLNGEFVKINIHFNVNGELLKLCETINHNINQHAIGLIRFGVKNIAIPHISLFIGYINSFEQFEFILDQVSNYSSKTRQFRIDPTQLYLKSSKKRNSKYLFLDLLQNQQITEHQKHFCDLFTNRIKPWEWNILEETPHITLGCYKSMTNIAIKEIEKYHRFPSCQIEDIGISISGAKGVCLGNLKSFKLVGNI